MKFTVTFKTPDAVDDAVRDAVRDEVKRIPDLSADEAEDLIDARCSRVLDKLRHWFEDGEYVRVEVDTDADTATVLRDPP